MSEAEEKVIDVAAEALYSDDEIEVFVDDAPPSDSEQGQLIAELKAKQAELQSKVDPVEAMKTAIQGLAGSISPKEALPDVGVRAQGVQDWQAYKENFNSKVFEDPFQMVTDLVSKATEMQSASVANQNLAYSKRLVQLDPATAVHYKKWADEVEREVAKTPVAARASNPNVYEDALGVVKSRHIDELIEERLSAERQSISQPPARQPAYSETGAARVAVPAQAGAAPRQSLKVSAGKMREITAYAEEWGIPEEAAIRLFQKRNML